MPSPASLSGLTRRQALALGAAAGVTVSVGAPAAGLAAVAPDATGGPHLRRSTYAALVGEAFAAGGHTLTLSAVGDVLGALDDPGLRGHEHAFELTFDGDADVLPAAIHRIFHPLLGPFDLFVGPVGAVRGLAQSYGVTVDRSLRVRSAPEPAAARAEGADESGEGAEAPEPSARDLAILEEREAARITPQAERRRAARRTRRRLAATRAERLRYQRGQRSRLRRTRRGWLTRHGR